VEVQGFRGVGGGEKAFEKGGSTDHLGLSENLPLMQGRRLSGAGKGAIGGVRKKGEQSFGIGKEAASEF